MRKTINAVHAEIDANLPDNTTQLITPALVRALLHDALDSLSPGYGAARSASLTLIALGAQAQTVVYDTALVATSEYAVDSAAGTITRLSLGLPSTQNHVSFSADVGAPNGNVVVFSLFQDGVDIPGGTTVAGQGYAAQAQAAFSSAITAEDSLDHVYTVKASKLSGGADNVDLANVRFLIELVPTLGI